MSHTPDILDPSPIVERRWGPRSLAAPLAGERGLALGLALLLLALNAPFLSVPNFWDSLWVFGAAEHMLHNGFSPLPPPAWDYGHSTGLSMLLALVWLPFGKSLLAAHLLNLVFAYLAVLFTYRLGRALYGQRVGLIAAALLMAYPLFRAQSTVVYTELPAAAFSVMALEAVVRGRTLRYALYGSAMVLMKLTAVVLVPAVLVYLLVARGRRQPWSRTAADLALHAIPLAVTLAWFGYHYLATGWVSDPRNMGLLAPEARPASAGGLLPFVAAALLSPQGAPAQLVALSWTYFGKMFLTGLLTALIVAYSVSLRPLGALARGGLSRQALGAALADQPLWRVWGRQSELLLLGLPILFHLGLMAVTTSMHRYLLPEYCLFFILAARALCGLFDPARLTLRVLLAVLIIFSIATTVPWLGHSLSSPSTLRYLDFVKTHQAAAAYLEASFPDAVVVARRPEYTEIAMPVQGYVTRPMRILSYGHLPIHVARIEALGGEVFTDPEALTAEEFDLVYLSGRTLPDNAYQPDGTVIEDLVERLGLPLVAEFRLNAEYVRLYGSPRLLAGRPPR